MQRNDEEEHENEDKDGEGGIQMEAILAKQTWTKSPIRQSTYQGKKKQSRAAAHPEIKHPNLNFKRRLLCRVCHNNTKFTLPDQHLQQCHKT